VVFPIYQTTLFDSPDYTDNAMVALQDAYAVLDGVEHVAADPVNFALVGHSLGGTIAANLASRAIAAGLPAPRALMLAHAGDADTVIRAVPSILDPDLSGIPPDMLMLAVVGDDDALVDETDALRIFDAAPQVATKEIVLIPTDDRGLPPLISNHHNPLAFDAAFDSGQSLLLRGQPPVRAAAATVDTHDFFGYWKLLDGLTSFAFFGRNREFALGRAPEQQFMGRWGDGVPVRQAEVIWP
jgi:pimeloyl-ACP methyl ester carboxylesterase